MDIMLDAGLEEGEIHNLEARPGKLVSPKPEHWPDAFLCTYFSGKDPKPNAVLKSYETNDVTYEFTATTFKKTSRLPFNDPYPDGTPFIWFRPW